MTLETANRLVALRKEKGYSQEALAEKLGLSRQSISKWERGEASPDTDNLIALAEIYGMTLDQLLSTENKPAPEAEQKSKKIKRELNSLQKKGKTLLSLFPIVSLAIIAVYVIGGFAVQGFWWGKMWLLFLVIPIHLTVALALYFGKTRQITMLALTVPTALAAAVIYLICGLFAGLWASAWIVFLLIPVYAYAAFLLTKKK